MYEIKHRFEFEPNNLQICPKNGAFSQIPNFEFLSHHAVTGLSITKWLLANIGTIVVFMCAKVYICTYCVEKCTPQKATRIEFHVFANLKKVLFVIGCAAHQKHFFGKNKVIGCVYNLYP